MRSTLKSTPSGLELQAGRVSLRQKCQVGLLILATSLGIACSSQRTLEQEHAADLQESTTSPLEVVDYFPAAGVPGVPKNIQPYFVFNRAVSDPAELELTLATATGAEIPSSFVLDFDGAGVRFIPDASVSSSSTSSYKMTLEAEPLATQDPDTLVEGSTFSTSFPSGLMFNVSTELWCEEFGGNGAQARLLNSYFIPGEYPLWIMVAQGLTSQTSLPTTTTLYLGPAYIRDNGLYRIYRHVGFSTVFRGVQIAADGSFRAALEGEFLPLDTPDQVVLTYMVEPVLSGRLVLNAASSHIEDLRIEGIFPARSLLLLSEASEAYATAVNMVDLNVDLNGNGTNDSATFVVTSSPSEISADQWDP